jgi:hypothetical protein
MKKRKFSVWFFISFFTLMLLYISVLFAFYFQRSSPMELRFLFPFSVILLFALFVLSACLSINKMSISDLKKLILYFSFIIINTTVLISLSSIKRESEIMDYYAKNKNNYESLIKYYQKNGKDSKFSAMLKDMNIHYFRYANEEYHIGLYSFLGYGYRLIYSEKTISKPRSPGGSPTQKWFKINKNWYYYSYND